MMEWFIGVVEDRNDPEMMGRVRVRIIGAHTDNKNEIPTESLPWSAVMTPTTSASISGIGTNPSIVEGTWVVGFFHDGESMQDPIIMGTLPGRPSEKRSSTVGFTDPNGVYPTYTDAPDINARARGEQGTPYEGVTSDTFIEPIDGWDTYAAEYPYNQIKHTESGHYKEYDDTADAERIKEYHKSGTFYEVQPNGSIVQHIVKENYRIVLDDENIYVAGDVNMHIKGDWNIHVEGSMDLNVDETITMDSVNGNFYLNQDRGNAWAAARKGDTADTGDAGTGGHFDTNSAGTDLIETGSGSVFIGK